MVKTSQPWPPTVQPGAESLPEMVLLNRLKRHRFPTPETQVALIPGRKFRFDIVWPQYKVAVECQGGVWVKGAHVRGKHYESDAEKSALAQIMGYIVIYLTPGMVESPSLLGLLLIDGALTVPDWQAA